MAPFLRGSASKMMCRERSTTTTISSHMLSQELVHHVFSFLGIESTLPPQNVIKRESQNEQPFSSSIQVIVLVSALRPTCLRIAVGHPASRLVGARVYQSFGLRQVQWKALLQRYPLYYPGNMQTMGLAGHEGL